MTAIDDNAYKRISDLEANIESLWGEIRRLRAALQCAGAALLTAVPSLSDMAAEEPS